MIQDATSKNCKSVFLEKLIHLLGEEVLQEEPYETL